jgi:hypothetical protein
MTNIFQRACGDAYVRKMDGLFSLRKNLCFVSGHDFKVMAHTWENLMSFTRGDEEDFRGLKARTIIRPQRDESGLQPLRCLR